jgi:hypothetical protein
MSAAPNLTTSERVLVSLDAFPLGALMRVVIGYATLVTWQFVRDGIAAEWQVALWFVAVLLAIRLVPAMLRKILPLPSGAVAVWVYRRRLAKLADSYQWRKLFWLGVGMTAYVASAESPSRWEIGLAVAAVVSGAFAEWVWRRRWAGQWQLATRVK